MQTLKKILFTDWNFMRWLRLILGIIITEQGIQVRDSIIGLIGGFFLLQALANMSCGIGGFSVPGNRKKISSSTEDAEYEEIK